MKSGGEWGSFRGLGQPDIRIKDAKRTLAQSREVVLQATRELASKPIFLPSNVSVHFDFGPHETAEDLGPTGSFEAMIKASDIYIDEQFGWDDATVKSVKLIAQGNAKEYQTLRSSNRSEFAKRVMSALFSTRKPVAFIDVRSDDPLYEDIRSLTPKNKHQAGFNADEPLDDIVARWVETNQDWATATNYRDSLMLSRIGSAIQEILKNNQKLRDKDDVRVLVRLGGMHTNVFEKLREAEGVDPSRITSESRLGDQVLLPGDAHMMKIAQGVTIDPEEEKRIFLRNRFSKTVEVLIAEDFAEQWSHLGHYERNKALNDLSDMFSTNELWELMTFNPGIATEAGYEVIKKMSDTLKSYFTPQSE